MKLLRSALAATLMGFAFPSTSSAQCTPTWSRDFTTVTFTGKVEASVSFDDGQGPGLYVAGEFLAIDGTSAKCIARWRDTDGWKALGGGVAGDVIGGVEHAYVHALAVYDDGSGPALFAAGEFTSVAGVPCAGIARWKNGAWSPLGTGLAGYFNDVRAHSLCVHDDGNGAALYVGGNFTTAGGQATSKIARWNGTTWSAVGSGIEGEQGHAVYAMASYGGALYAGGEFFGAEGQNFPSIARWDGAHWTLPGGGASGRVLAMKVFDDGSGPQLYVGGTFTSLGVPAPGISRWNGTTWSAPALGPSGTIQAFDVFDVGTGSELYVAGTFGGVNGVATGNVVRWNHGAWGGVSFPPPMVTFALTHLVDSFGARLVAGGVGGAGVSAWNGTQWRPVSSKVGGLGTQINTYGNAVQAFDHGAALGRFVYVGGKFGSAGDTPNTQNIARFDGTRWSSVGNATGSIQISGPEVRVFTTFDDGVTKKLVAGGIFLQIGGVAARTIATYDGVTWAPLGSGLGAGAVDEIVTFDDGSGATLYAGGSFTIAGTQPATGFARWDGTEWQPVAVPVNAFSPQAMCVFDDGGGSKIYVGGYFLNGSPQPWRMLQFDGTNWTDVSAGLPTATPATALGTFDDGNGRRLYAGTQGGRLLVWDGAQWNQLATGLGTISSLDEFDDGSGPKLYISAGGFLRWTGSAIEIVGGVSGWVAGMSVLETDAGKHAYVTGSFGAVNSPAFGLIPSHSFGRYGSPCPPSGTSFCSGDGSATACPCGNVGGAGRGCANSFDASGASLVASGNPRVSADSLTLSVTGVSNSVVTFLQGSTAVNGGQGFVFGDGLRCAGGNVIRLGTVLASNASAQYPSGVQQPVSVRGFVPPVGNVTRTYQVWYRDSPSFCTPSTFSLSNGVRTFWAP